MAKAQKNFLNAALILTVANFAVKIIGAIYKIPLANLITPMGMNYYNDAYQIYSLLYVLSTAGVPVAIAKMVSETIVERRLKEPKKILKVSTSVFAIIGIVLAALMIIFVEPLSNLLASDTANHCITLIAPAIFLVAVSSTIKGYFQGYKCVTPSAVFQIIEASFKLAGLGIIGIMRYQGIIDPMILACGGILGVTFGSFAASVFMVIRYLCEHDFGRNVTDSLPSRSVSTLVKKTVTLAIPISLSSAVMSVTSTIDMFLVKWSLAQYGLNNEAVKEVYGAYAGGTSSMFNLVPAITISVGIAVLPYITSSLAAGNKEDAFKNMRSAAKVVAIISIPGSGGMSVMSEAIIKLLFTQDYWEVSIPTLAVLALSIFFVCFVSLTGSYLHAAGKVKTTLMTMGAGAVMKLVVNIVAVRNIGIMGAPLGTFACYATITLLNLYFIRKYIGFKLPIKDVFIKPFVCSLLCCITAYGSWKLLSLTGMHLLFSLGGALVLAVIVYVIALIAFKVLAKEDLELLPGGVAALMVRKGWVHE